MEDVAAENWHGQLLVTVARATDFFGYSFAEAPYGGHTEETSEDVEEAEFDKA
jgi:hypothetical protein